MTLSHLPTQCLSDYDGDATVDIYDDDDDDDGVLDTDGPMSNVRLRSEH